MNARKASADYGLLENQAAAHTSRGFTARLRAVGSEGVAVIAEIKKASPSLGLIRADFYPEKFACTFEAAGAFVGIDLEERRLFAKGAKK